MPVARISEQSALLTPGGWVSAARLLGQVEIIGLDRAGQPTSNVVGLAKGGASNVSYLGTSAAFGAFSMHSRLLLADGSPVDVAQLVDAGCITDFHFEVFRPARILAGTTEAADSLWNTLKQVAALHDSSKMILRCAAVDSESAKDTRPDWALLISSKKTGYIVLRREPFLGAYLQHPDRVLSTIGSLCLRSAEDASWQAERELHLIMCALVDVLREQGTHTEFTFDTLQHTCFVYLSPSDVSPPPIGPGRCAFATAIAAEDLSLTWQDGSFTPSVSGFLLYGHSHP